MAPTRDEIAGIVDLFGALTRGELRGALENLAAKAGREFDPDGFESRLEAAREDYYLVEVEHDDTPVLAPGPAALPALPEYGEDLPHILDVEPRSVDRDALAGAVGDRLRTDAAQAVDAGDTDRIETLLDVCYEVDAWAGLDTADLRDRLTTALEG